MFHESSKRISIGVFVGLLLITVPAYAVKEFKVSNYGAGVQIWFEAEDFDQRNPDTNGGFGLTDEPGAFGRSITQTSGTYGAYLLRYDFDISLAGGSGGTWYFWGRVINPNNRSSFMLVEGHPGDPVPSTLPVSGLVNGQRIFEDDIGSTWTWARTNHAEAHTKTLRDGMNTMYVLSRETNGIMDVFMWTNDPAYVPTDQGYQDAGPARGYGPVLRPDPANGAVIAAMWVSLGWRAGDFAVSHDIYLGESFDDVNTGTGGTLRANQAREITSFFVGLGLPGDPYPGGLVPGTTYYWRVDEVNAADPNSPWKGPVWSFSIPPRTAYNPNPPDGAKFIPTDVKLSWTAGLNTKLHYVYFGDNLETVSNATVGIPAGAATFTPPGPLALDKTYYWRVDQFDGAATHKGDVWSFTTTLSGLGTAIMERWENISGTALSGLKGDPRYPASPDVTETVTRFAWDGPDTNNYGARISGWLYVPAIGDYTFWLNTDDSGELWLSTDDDPGNARLIAQETGYTSLNVWNTGEEQSQPISLLGGEKYYIMALWKEGSGGDHCQVAWQGPTVPTRAIIPGTNLSPYEPLNTYGANPANGATGVKQVPALKWKPGLQAASHELYFGTDPNAVRDATKTSPEFKGTRALGAESYSPGTLAWQTTYYWRIDEVNNTNPKSPWVGKVWSFTTADFAVIDDFEGYTDNDKANEAIWQTWSDGFATPTTNGALVGNNLPPYAEQTIVHGGQQSMPLAYNNAGTAKNSEAALPLTYPRDWTVEGVTALSLWYHAEPGNAAERMYVAISNRTGAAAVVYNNAIQPTTIDVWRRWNIPIQAFADQGVNLKDVDRIVIGFGTKGGTAPGGTGKMYIDDIGLYRSVPAPPEEIVLEAEAVTSITAPLTVRNDALASGGKCIGTDVGIGNESTNPPATGVATYSITVKGGVYRLVGRVIIPSGDSFWLRIPDATTQTTNHPASGWVRWSDPANGDTWHWENVFSGDDAGQTVQFTLAAGTHTLEIARREDGALLDAILITTDVE